MTWTKSENCTYNISLYVTMFLVTCYPVATGGQKQQAVAPSQ